MPIGILLISTAMPAACFCQMFAEKFDCEVSFGSLGVSLSTILCIATIPLMMLIGQLGHFVRGFLAGALFFGAVFSATEGSAGYRQRLWPRPPETRRISECRT